jgi:hypothetical protein
MLAGHYEAERFGRAVLVGVILEVTDVAGTASTSRPAP